MPVLETVCQASWLWVSICLTVLRWVLMLFGVDISFGPSHSRGTSHPEGQRDRPDNASNQNFRDEEQKIFDKRHGSCEYFGLLDAIRREEFGRLKDVIYVDHAGATLYSERQIENFFKELQSELYGNPHSGHAGADGMVERIALGRRLTLNMCNADSTEYDVIFTSGATAALKLVAESFPWSPDSLFCYNMDNHTSVMGMREVIRDSGARAVAVTVQPGRMKGTFEFSPCSPLPHQSETPSSTLPSSTSAPRHHLLAFPLESNFTGVRYDPRIIPFVQNHGVSFHSTSSPDRTSTPVPSSVPDWTSTSVPSSDPDQTSTPVPSSDPHLESGATRLPAPTPTLQSQPSRDTRGDSEWFVLCDAAKACGTCPPDLKRFPADFVVLSYYKVFGYPTGLGALLVRKRAMRVLRRKYFGGGTVAMCIANEDTVRWREGADGFEDGTMSYLGVAALPHGFEAIQRLGGFSAVHQHTTSLTNYLSSRLLSLKHFNGRPVCQLYGHHSHPSHNSHALSSEEPATSAATSHSAATNQLQADAVSSRHVLQQSATHEQGGTTGPQDAHEQGKEGITKPGSSGGWLHAEREVNGSIGGNDMGAVAGPLRGYQVGRGARDSPQDTALRQDCSSSHDTGLRHDRSSPQDTGLRHDRSIPQDTGLRRDRSSPQDTGLRHTEVHDAKPSTLGWAKNETRKQTQSIKAQGCDLNGASYSRHNADAASESCLPGRLEGSRRLGESSVAMSDLQRSPEGSGSVGRFGGSPQGEKSDSAFERFVTKLESLVARQANSGADDSGVQDVNFDVNTAVAGVGCTAGELSGHGTTQRVFEADSGTQAVPGSSGTLPRQQGRSLASKLKTAFRRSRVIKQQLNKESANLSRNSFDSTTSAASSESYSSALSHGVSEPYTHPRTQPQPQTQTQPQLQPPTQAPPLVGPSPHALSETHTQTQTQTQTQGLDRAQPCSEPHSSSESARRVAICRTSPAMTSRLPHSPVDSQQLQQMAVESVEPADCGGTHGMPKKARRAELSFQDLAQASVEAAGHGKEAGGEEVCGPTVGIACSGVRLAPGILSSVAVGQGPVVTFTVMRSDGSFVGFREVEKLAALNNIQLRTGCLCNPGACAIALGLTPEDVKASFAAGHVCGDDKDIVNGRPTGVIRVSFGYMSSYSDARAVGDLIQKYFVETTAPPPPLCPLPPHTPICAPPPVREGHAAATGASTPPRGEGEVHLEQIFVYPVKSCRGMEVTVWPLTPKGLLYDREWLIVDEWGNAVSQKKVPALATIQPKIDIQKGMLELSAPGHATIGVPIGSSGSLRAQESHPIGPVMEQQGSLEKQETNNATTVNVRVCGTTFCTEQVGGSVSNDNAVRDWLSGVTGIPCRLVRQRQTKNSTRHQWQEGGGPATADEAPSASRNFANDGQFLLLSSASIQDLNVRLRSSKHGRCSVTAAQFRPNLVVSGPNLLPCVEDSWQGIRLGQVSLSTLRLCSRCDMVCRDQSTGRYNGPEPLLTLASYRRSRGGINFGILMGYDENSPFPHRTAVPVQTASFDHTVTGGEEGRQSSGDAAGPPILEGTVESRDESSRDWLGLHDVIVERGMVVVPVVETMAFNFC